MLTRRQLTTFHKRLLAWFEAHKRPMAWRANRDAYRIWISEVMLQQTTVAAVGPYFERFMTRFPTVTQLAEAEESEVLKLWQGLGYYRRARHLHAAAKILVNVQASGGCQTPVSSNNRNRGLTPPARLPDDPELWASLPGVGRYILGAVLSQAFDRLMPIVEANTLRLLCRLFVYEDDPRSTTGQKWLWQTAEELLPKSHVGDFNQAMMELGSLVCTPRNPDCPSCPVNTYCQSFERGLQDRIPLTVIRKATVDIAEIALVIRKRGNVLLCHRPDTAKRWANMWEFPHGELSPGEIPGIIATRRITKELTGLKIQGIEPLTALRHTVTHHKITMNVYMAEWSEGRFKSDLYDKAEWISPDKLDGYPTSSPQAKLMKLVTES